MRIQIIQSNLHYGQKIGQVSGNIFHLRGNYIIYLKGWFYNWGSAKPVRPTQDIAFSIARFFARGGSLVNLYMLQGFLNKKIIDIR